MPARTKPTALKLELPFLATVVGRRGSGKSNMLRFLLRTIARAGQVRDVWVFTSTAFTGDWGRTVGEHRVYENFDEELLNGILQRQAAARAAGTPNEALLILDDVLGSMSFTSSVWKLLASTGRHYNLSVLLVSQHYHAIPPLVRLNSDYFMLLGPTSERAWRSAYQEFAPTKTWQELKAAGETAVGPLGQALVVDQRSPPHLKVIRAPPPSQLDFKIV
jgi:hypothetical protein